MDRLAFLRATAATLESGNRAHRHGEQCGRGSNVPLALVVGLDERLSGSANRAAALHQTDPLHGGLREDPSGRALHSWEAVCGTLRQPEAEEPDRRPGAGTAAGLEWR